MKLQTANVLETHSLYDLQGNFGGWPSIARTADAELLVVSTKLRSVEQISECVSGFRSDVCERVGYRYNWIATEVSSVRKMT